MSFDVFLVASASSPLAVQYQAELHMSLTRVGANSSPDPVVIRMADGGELELFGGKDQGAMFALRELTPGVCDAIYAAAVGTNSYIVFAGENTPALKVAAAGAPPPDFLPIKQVASAAQVCDALRAEFMRWRNEVGR